MSKIKTADGKGSIDIDELNLLAPRIVETGLTDNDYKGEILIDVKNPFGTLGTIYKISFDKGIEDKNKKKAELEEKVYKKLMPEIEKIIGDAKKNEKSVTINLCTKKYHLSDLL